jgi:hypothetical protein
MQRLAFMFFAIAVVVSTAYIVATGQDLPARVASHFGLRGTADAFMPRDKYLLVFGLISFLVPIGVVAVSAIAVRVRPGYACKRNREFWSRPENRAAAITYCTTASMIKAGLLSVFLAVVHSMVLQANQVQPPRLPFPAFAVLLGLFAVVSVAVSWMFRLHMGRIAREGRRADA